MPRTLASSGSNIDDTTASSSDLLQSDTQDSAAQAEVPESRTENDDLQLETNTLIMFPPRLASISLGMTNQMNDSADDEQTEELITREEFDREDEASSEVAKGGFLDTYFTSIRTKIDTKDPYKKLGHIGSTHLSRTMLCFPICKAF
ncbi:hypothetical protein [Parasitella parasitica]|uniref:Uncharacterized protein n=1 Tax=Parasitella parasitica TaxID=35722 RepID=A0A0B7NXP3_9FUNG|nr:hypothetical protein [Parasitella parasitica]